MCGWGRKTKSVLIRRRLATRTAKAWTIGARIFAELEEPTDRRSKICVSVSTGAEFLLVAEALAVILRTVWQLKENPPFSM
jgi:hypothetical protein